MHLVASGSLEMGPQKGQAGNLQKQFHKANVKKKKKKAETPT